MEQLNGFRFVGAVEDDTKEDSNNLASVLKTMLAEAYVLYHTIHGFHWNVKGTDFYEYHKMFNKIYDDIYESVDAIAENIKKLGEDAPFTMSQLVKISNIEEVGLISKDPKELSKKFIEMNEQYITNIKNVFNIADKNNEQGIANFIAERIDQHQKHNWFLKSSIGD
jgi:starvation-inducible DNA-binding protein